MNEYEVILYRILVLALSNASINHDTFDECWEIKVGDKVAYRFSDNTALDVEELCRTLWSKEINIKIKITK